MSRERVERLRERMTQEGLDAFLVSRPENRLYLSGFTGSNGLLLITSEDAYLLTDFRYTEQARAQAPHCQVIQYDKGWAEGVQRVLAVSPGARVGFEKSQVTYQMYQELQDKMDAVTWVPVGGLVEEQRAVKDAAEIACIEKSVALTDQAFAHILPYLRPGVEERHIALELEYFLRRQGATGPAFEFIVASGNRSSLPHGVAGTRQLQKGDLVVIDFGAVVDSYHSDMTRTVVMGEPSQKQREIYQIVLDAQMKALEALGPGKKGVEIDRVSRDFIAAKGYGEYFGHGLGHGVGLAIHEEPRLSAGGNYPLKPGMVVTVEPGIYLPQWGGARIEDMALITEEGCRVLTRTPKDLLIV